MSDPDIAAKLSEVLAHLERVERTQARIEGKQKSLRETQARHHERLAAIEAVFSRGSRETEGDDDE